MKPWGILYNCICVDGQAVTIMFLLGSSLFVYSFIMKMLGEDNS